ncbi:MAG: methyltransferase type 11 [Brevundimonas sp.]|uniref:methyltransferase type 11 n=1 Tax=Brevundimonas sp. TaxID=1871086 RepID=UPI00391C836A
MRALIIVPVCVAAFVSACDSEPSIRISRDGDQHAETGGALRVVDALQCPQVDGVLTRRGAPAADGLSCEYTGPRGSQVTLRLVRLNGTGLAALDGLESEVQQLLPSAINRVGGSVAAASGASRTSPDSAADGEQVDVRVPGVSIQAQGENATVRIPGISIDTDGGQSSVRIGGFSIRTDEAGDQVNISTDSDAVRIRAQEQAVEIRTRDTGQGIRATYILVDERGSELDWRLVGYEARGPEGGPLVVAVVRSKDRREDDVFDAAKSLVRLNVGD